MKFRIVFFVLITFFCGCAGIMNQEDWYRNCRVRLVMHEGKMNGPVEIYMPGGQIQHKGMFVNDKKDGVWTVWESTGVKIAEISYKSGVLNGPIILYYGSYLNSGRSAGNIKLEAIFVSGKYDGKYKTFWFNGAKRTEVEYSGGEIVKVQLFDRNGQEVIIDKQKAIEYANQDKDADIELLNSYDKFAYQSIKLGQRIE